MAPNLEILVLEPKVPIKPPTKGTYGSFKTSLSLRKFKWLYRILYNQCTKNPCKKP